MDAGFNTHLLSHLLREVLGGAGVSSSEWLFSGTWVMWPQLVAWRSPKPFSMQ